jgi:hypothetical protein
MVTVTHDGDKPVNLRIVGDVIISQTGIKSFDRVNPLTLTTPAEFMVNLERQPVIIESKGNDFIRVVADHQLSAQRLVARARRVTIRAVPPKEAREISRIEIIGEAKAGSSIEHS